MNMMDQITKTAIEIIQDLLCSEKPLIVSIDGRCASGKTTLAMALQSYFHCNVIHMDHFFLRPEQRTLIRMNTPGENVDHERFLEEVLVPLRKGEDFFYRPFHCGSQTFADPILVRNNPLTIVEGSYSCHEKLRDYYDLHIFMSVDSKEQMRRVLLRNGPDQAAVFQSKWIPLEEAYFSAFDVEQRADHCFGTSQYL